MTNMIVKVAHKMLENAEIYNFFQKAVGHFAHAESLTKDIISSQSNFLLDLGCGTGQVLSNTNKETKYVGVDLSKDYIATALNRSSDGQARFVNSSVTSSDWLSLIDYNEPTTGIAWGLYHHLNNTDLNTMLSNLTKTIRPGSILNSLDPVVLPKTKKMARWFAENDRGKFLRTPTELNEIFTNHGFQFNYSVETNAIRIPVDVVIGRAIKI